MPGFGLTPSLPEMTLSPVGYASFLNQLLFNMNVRGPVHVIGHSFGGSIGMYFARAFPDHVQSLVMIGTGFPDDDDARGSALLDCITTAPIIRDIMRCFTPRCGIRQFLRDGYGDPTVVTENEVDRYHNLLRKKGHRATMIKIQSKDDTEVLKGCVGMVHCPVLTLWGLRDKFIPFVDAQKFLTAFDGSSVIVYTDVGHFCVEEIPALMASDILRFASGAVPQRAAMIVNAKTGQPEETSSLAVQQATELYLRERSVTCGCIPRQPPDLTQSVITTL